MVENRLSSDSFEFYNTIFKPTDRYENGISSITNSGVSINAKADMVSDRPIEALEYYNRVNGG